MTCEEFLRRLDDGRDPADPEAAEHARSCPACAGVLARWQATQRELRAMSAEDAPPFLHARVMAHVRAETAPHRRRWRLLPSTRTVLATAAVAIVAALAGYEVLRQRNIPLPPLPLPGATHSTALPPRPATAPPEKAGVAPETTLAAAPARPAPPRLEAAKALPKAAPPVAERNLAAAGASLAASASEGGAVVGESTPAPSFARPAADAVAPGAMPEGAPIAEDRRQITAGMAAALPAAAPAAVVACVLGAAELGPTRVLDLPPTWAPPAGESWPVTVAADGAVAIADPHGADITTRLPGLRARLAALGLPPGRYLLARRSG